MSMLTEISDVFYFPATRLCYINHELCDWHFYFTNMLNKRQKFGINFVWQKQCFSKVAESTDFPLCTEQEFPLLLIFLELKISNLFQFHRSQMVFALVFNFHFLALSNSAGYHLPPRLLCGMSAQVRDPQVVFTTESITIFNTFF